MKCLTKPEIEHWLDDNSVIPEPYGKQVPSSAYIQFTCPAQHLVIESFLRNLILRLTTKPHCLVDVTDWSLYTPSQMLVFDTIRSEHGESRWLIDATGHLFASDEHELTIAMFSLATSFQWSSYLYFPDDVLTVYNWEGELYDFWTREENLFQAMKELIEMFDLKITSGGYK